jgi:hypothetical protein
MQVPDFSRTARTAARCLPALLLFASSACGVGESDARTGDANPGPGAVPGRGDAGRGPPGAADAAESARPPQDAPGDVEPQADTARDANPGDANAEPIPGDANAHGNPRPDAGVPAVDPPARCPSPAPDPLEPPAATRMIRVLTGTQSSAGRFGVGGTDLGIPVRQPDGRIAYIFGDTFEQDTVGGPGWRSPVLLRSNPGLDDRGIEFTSAAGGAYAKQILDYAHDGGQTWLPSDALTIGQRMYLHFIVNAGLGNVVRTQIAYSDDNGENWTVSDAEWAADEDAFLRQLWTWERGCDGFVYVMSTKFISRDRPIILYRVPEARLLEREAYVAWGFRDGAWAWGNPPTPILEGRFGELSLRLVENKWVLSWFDADAYGITVKVFDDPTSNLYEARTFEPISGNDVPQLYGGYIHPDSTLANLHLIVSQWNTATNWPYHAMEWVTSVR